MFWTEEVALQCQKRLDAGASEIVVNDSKTPSGRVHVGALRGVLIHDAIFRTLRERGMPARYLFGVDDFDPVDEIPKGEDAHFTQHLGKPLCNTPAPGNSTAADMAEHYMGEFWTVFEDLGVQVERYRMRDVYRQGRFDQAIDTILRNAEKVRRVYKEVSNSDRPETWYPFQVICEQCGRIGTTEVFDYDGALVRYRCRPNLVKWATGCGHEGRMSPFGGNGKLPWKLEWVAKWVSFPVTMEGAGKDHSTKGGSRDVSAACLRAIFDLEPPVNAPYEFFLVGGKKMSSSKGIGVSAREMTDFLPREVLRYLLIRTKPNSVVDFDVTKEETMVKLFNEFDRNFDRSVSGKATPDEKLAFSLAAPTFTEPHYEVNFQVVAALVQMPHLDPAAEAEIRKGAPFTELETQLAAARIHAARTWVERYADDDEKTRLQDTLPERAKDLSDSQRAFLHAMASALEDSNRVAWNDDALQAAIFDVARMLPIDQPSAFKAMYRVLLDRVNGPKAGNLLAFLDREFVVKRFRELSFDKVQAWRETASTPDDLTRWLEKEGSKITERTWTWVMEGSTAAVEITFSQSDGKRVLKRLLAEGVPVDRNETPAWLAHVV